MADIIFFVYMHNVNRKLGHRDLKIILDGNLIIL